MTNWNKIIRELPGQYLHGQNPQQSGRAISVFYNLDKTWDVFQADADGHIENIGHFQAKELFAKLRELGFEMPLDIQDQHALHLPYDH